MGDDESGPEETIHGHNAQSSNGDGSVANNFDFVAIQPGGGLERSSLMVILGCW